MSANYVKTDGVKEERMIHWLMRDRALAFLAGVYARRALAGGLPRVRRLNYAMAAS